MTDDPRYKGPFNLNHTGSVADLLQKVLDNTYKVTSHGYIEGTNLRGASRSYERISVSHEGGREMVLDLRFIPMQDYAGKEGIRGIMKEPVIAVRQQGQAGEAPEALFGGKVFREKGESQYQARGPIETLADLIKAGHKYYEEVPYAATGARTPTSSFTAIASAAATGRATKEAQKIIKEYQIAPSLGLGWGEQNENYYRTISEGISIAWGPEKRYKERQLLAASLQNLRYQTNAPIHYDPVHDVLRGARVHRYTSEYGFSVEEEELPRLAEGGLKTAKQMPSVLEAREEAHPVIRKWEEANRRFGPRRRMEPKTAEEQFNRPETWGETLGRRGGIYYRYGAETRLLVSGLITQLPGGAGAAFAAKGALGERTIEGEEVEFAFESAKTIPLPWKTTTEFINATEELKKRRKEFKLGKGAVASALMFGSFEGKAAPANARRGVKLGEVSVWDPTQNKLIRKPIYTESRSYETQVDDVTVVLPKFYNVNTGEFSGIVPGGLTEDQRVQWQETATMDKRFRALFGKRAKVEYSGTSHMYISYIAAGMVDPGFKLLGGKESIVQTGVDEWTAKVRGLGVARARVISQETKSAADRWIGAFTAMPYENKMRILDMTDPNLGKEVRRLVNSGDINPEDVKPELIAKIYAPMTKGRGEDMTLGEYWSPRQIIGTAIMKILNETDATKRAENYRRFGFYRVSSSNEEVGTMIYTQESVDFERKAIFEKFKKQPEDIGIHYVPITGKKGMYRVVSKLPKDSYFMPLVYGTTVEWPMKGGTMPSKAVEKFNAAFPDYFENGALMPGLASKLGMRADAGVLGAGDPSRSTRAWVELLKSDKLRQSSVLGETYRTDKTLMIDKNMAAKILEELQLTQGKIAEAPVSQEMVRKLGKILSEKNGKSPDMIYFKGTQAFMPTTRVAMYLDEWNKATEASQTGLSGRYLSAILDLLNAEAYGAATPGLAYRRWVNFSETMIEKSFNKNKVLGKVETGRVVARNYNILDQLAPNEGAISDVQLEAIARMQPGVRTQQDVQAFVKFVNDLGYLPAFFHRLPSVGGVHAVKLLTAKTVKELYDVDINADVASAKGTMWINRWMHESGIGDRDIDKALIWSGLVTKREKGKLTVRDVVTATTQWKTAMSKRGQEYIKEFSEGLGDNADLIKKYSHLAQYYGDYAEAYTGGLKWQKTADFGWVRAGFVNDMAKMWSEIRSRRATSYNAVEFMKEAVNVLGIGGDQLTRALGAYGITNIQSSLEATLDAGVKPTEEGVFASIRSNDEGGAVISMGIPDPKVVGKVNFSNVYRPDQAMPLRHVMINNLLMAYTGNPNVSNEMLGIVFGGNQKMAMKIMNLLKDKRPEDRWAALMDNKKMMEAIYGTTSIASLMSNFALERAAKSKDDLPLDLRKDLMGTAEMNVEKTLAILRAIRTGRDIRGFGFGDLRQALEITPKGTYVHERLLGLMRSFDMESHKVIPLDKEFGGLAKDLMQRAFREGMTTMRASDFGYVAQGIESGSIAELRKNKILYQKTMGMTAEWISQMYRLDKSQSMVDIFTMREDYDLLESGKAWEQYIAKRMKETLGVHVGGGRGYFEGKVGSTVFRFTPDFLKIENGKLIVTEAKKGGPQTIAAGAWQAAANKYGLQSMAQENEAQLRKVLTDYMKAHNENRQKLGGTVAMPELADDWVDQAVNLIKTGSVEARVFAVGKELGKETYLRVNFTKEQVEQMVLNVQRYLQVRAPKVTKELEMLEKERFTELEDRYKSVLTVKPGFKMPMGIRESFLRLFSTVKFDKPAGPIDKDFLIQQAKWLASVAQEEGKPLTLRKARALAKKFWGDMPDKAGEVQQLMDFVNQEIQSGKPVWDYADAEIGKTTTPEQTAAETGGTPPVVGGQQRTGKWTAPQGATVDPRVQATIDLIEKRAAQEKPFYYQNPVIAYEELYPEGNYVKDIPAEQRNYALEANRAVNPKGVQTTERLPTSPIVDKRTKGARDAVRASQTPAATPATPSGPTNPPPPDNFNTAVAAAGDEGDNNQGRGRGGYTRQSYMQRITSSPESVRNWVNVQFKALRQVSEPLAGAEAAAKELFLKKDLLKFEGLTPEQEAQVEALKVQAATKSGLGAVQTAISMGGPIGDIIKGGLKGEVGQRLLGALGQVGEVPNVKGLQYGQTWAGGQQIEGGQQVQGGLIGAIKRLFVPSTVSGAMVGAIEQQAPGVAPMVKNALNLAKTLTEEGLMGEKKAGKATQPIADVEKEGELGGLKKFKAELKGLDETFTKLGKKAGESTKLFTDLGTAMGNTATSKTLERLMDTMKTAGVSLTVPGPGGTQVAASPLQLMQKAALAAEAKIAAGGPEAEIGKELKQRAMAARDVVSRQAGMVARGEEETGGSLAHLARRALGGFGMMYLRTMAGMTLGGYTMGEQQALAMRQQFGQAAAQAAGGYGAGGPYISPAQRIEIMQGLYGTPQNPLQAAFGPLLGAPVGREVMGAGTMGIGTFAMAQQISLWGGNNPLTQAIGKYSLPIAGGAMVLGAIGDILNQAADTRSLGFRMTQMEAGRTFSFTAPFAEELAKQQRPEEYKADKNLALAMSIKAGGSNPQAQFANQLVSYKNPQTGLYESRPWTYAEAYPDTYGKYGAAKNFEEAIRMALPGGQNMSMVEVLQRGAPALAAEEALLHPETTAVAGEVSAFMIENGIAPDNYTRLAGQWQYGFANPQNVTGLMQAFGTNLSTMRGGIGAQVMQAMRRPMTMQERNIVNQGTAVASGLGAFSQNLGEQRGYTEAYQYIDLAKQMAPLYGTAGYSALQTMANVYMGTLGTGAGQMAAPNFNQYIGMSTAQAALAQQAATANATMFGTWQNISMTGARTAAPQYLGPNATYGEIQQANLTSQMLQETQGVNVGSLRRNLARQGTPAAMVQAIMSRITTTGLRGEQEAQYQAMRAEYSASLEAMNLPSYYGATKNAAPLALEFGGTQGRMAQQAAQAQQAAGWYQQAQAWGGPTQAYQQLGAWYANAAPGQASLFNQMMQANPMALAAMQQANPQAMAGVFNQNYAGYGGAISGNLFAMTGTQFGGATATGGAVNGMQWGTTNLALGNWNSMQVAQQMWGGGFTGTTWSPTTTGAGYSAGAINAAVNGFTLPNGQVVGGQWALQGWGNQMNYQNQMAQIGLQNQGNALTMAFTTGVGLGGYGGTVNPVTGQPFGFNTGQTSFNIPGVGGYTSQSGGFWGMQEAQMNLGWLQQQNQFNAQRQQMGIQSRQFYENIGMNIQQAQMQRGWTQQDWAYQTQTRGLQWQWRQEDFAENVRFMTGRERRLAERQMGRESTLYGLESEQIEKTRDRQKELWALEDERFEMQKRQYEENKKFQEEQLQIAMDFFEARKALEQESMLLQRAYWVQQMDLQKASAGLAAKAATDQYEYNNTLIAYNQWIEENMGKLKTLTDEGMQKLRDQIVINTIPAIDNLTTSLENLTIAGGGTNQNTDPNPGGGGPKNPALPTAAGYHGWAFNATRFIAGEGALPEEVTVTPLGQKTHRSAWNDTLIPGSGARTPQVQNVTIPIYVGDEFLEEKVIQIVDGNIKE